MVMRTETVSVLTANERTENRMDDLISRQAAIDAFYHATGDGDKAEWAVDVVKGLPSTRKTGKWVSFTNASGESISTAVHLYPVCSECGVEHPVANYCPNCGAKMEDDLWRD